MSDPLTRLSHTPRVSGRPVPPVSPVTPTRSRTLDALILARLTAIDEFAHLPTALWEWARVVLLCGGSTQQRLASVRLRSSDLHPTVPGGSDQPLVLRRVVAPEDMETLLVSVCLELLTLLGLGRADPNLAHAPALLCPDAWLRGELQSTIEVRTLAAPVVGTRRAKRSTLRISLTITSNASSATATSVPAALLPRSRRSRPPRPIAFAGP